MLYKYVAIDENGDRKRGVIEAVSFNEAASKLRANRLMFESIKPANESILSRFKRSSKSAIDPNLLSKISRDLAIYLNAGISIVNTIRLASKQYEQNRKLSHFFLVVATLLDEGKSFYVALESQGVYKLPEFYLESIRISEEGGMLSDVLTELSRFIKELESMKKQAKNALFYPAFIVLVSIAMIIFMMSVVVPQITDMFVQLGQELPKLTQTVISISNFFANWWLLLLVLTVVFSLLHGVFYNTTKSYKLSVDRLLLKIPVIGRIILTTELARFAYISSLLMRSGVSFVQTIRLAANVLSNSMLKEHFLNASQKVVEGGRFSVALAPSGVDPAFIQAIALGEETSELQEILSNLSLLYFEENRDRIGVMLSLLEPVMMLVVGGVVGVIVASMLLPIFSMNIGG